MHLLALACSPRKNGNTEILLDRFLEACRDHHADIEKIWLPALNLRPCAHCDFCLQNQTCRLDDDMKSLYPKLLETDVLVLASPIYFMAHAAQAKIFIDRCQMFWARRYVQKNPIRPAAGPPRRAVFIAVGATHGPQVFAGAKTTMKWFLDSLRMEYWDNLLIDGCDEKGAIRDHPTALDEAYRLGVKLVQSYRNT